MIDRAAARRIAEQRLEELSEQLGQPLAIDDRATMRGAAGWLFFWNTRSYLEEGSISDALAGNGPLLVEGETGAIDQLSSAETLEGFAPADDGDE